MLRVRRGGGLVATLTSAVARHPSGRKEAKPILGGRFHAVYPPDSMRRETMFRNRGYIFSRHGRPAMLLADVVRYGLFFLARPRPDWLGYRAWLRATWNGVCGRLGRPADVVTDRGFAR